MFLYRVEGGILVIDLGWWGAEDALARGLRELGGSADDVIAVFLTHSHRDHVAAWRSVRHAPFHLAAAEVDLLFGEETHSGWVPDWAEKLKSSDLPDPGEVEVRAFSTDTFMVFGTDTLRAFLVPGHTPGSAAYLFRTRLHAGDAIAHTWLDGYRHALGPYSSDDEEARRNLNALRQRLTAFDVQVVCTSHLKCSAATPDFWADLLED